MNKSSKSWPLFQPAITIIGELVCIAEGHNAPIKDVRWISESKII